MRDIFKFIITFSIIVLVCQNVSFASYDSMLTDTQLIKKIKKCDKKIDKHPDNVKLYVQRGFLKFCLKDYGSALEDYVKAEELSPDNSDIFYSRGRVWFARGNYTEAIDDFDKAIELN